MHSDTRQRELGDTGVERWVIFPDLLPCFRFFTQPRTCYSGNLRLGDGGVATVATLAATLPHLKNLHLDSTCAVLTPGRCCTGSNVL